MASEKEDRQQRKNQGNRLKEDMKREEDEDMIIIIKYRMDKKK